jgi:hypothetical protein
MNLLLAPASFNPVLSLRTYREATAEENVSQPAARMRSPVVTPATASQSRSWFDYYFLIPAISSTRALHLAMIFLASI